MEYSPFLLAVYKAWFVGLPDFDLKLNCVQPLSFLIPGAKKRSSSILIVFCVCSHEEIKIIIKEKLKSFRKNKL
jgi:hypothetical protein